MPSCLRISLVLFSIKDLKATLMLDRHMSGSEFIRFTRPPERNATVNHLNHLNHNLPHHEELINSISKHIKSIILIIAKKWLECILEMQFILEANTSRSELAVFHVLY